VAQVTVTHLPDTKLARVAAAVKTFFSDASTAGSPGQERRRGHGEGVGTRLSVARRQAALLHQPVRYVHPAPAGGLDYCQQAGDEQATRAALRTEAELAPEHRGSQGALGLVVGRHYTRLQPMPERPLRKARTTASLATTAGGNFSPANPAPRRILVPRRVHLVRRHQPTHTRRVAGLAARLALTRDLWLLSLRFRP
jgi:hypothetical protein